MDERHPSKIMVFQEQLFNTKKEDGGSIEVICGSMFSGKTEELIRRLKRARLAKLKVKIYSPKSDTRFTGDALISHNANSIPSSPVETALTILPLADHVNVVGIDEAQFFDDQLPDVCNKLANSGVRVIVAGLDMDFEGQPFGPMPALMAIADCITKLQAVCVKCGKPAIFSYRLVPGNEKILLGERESYEPRCRLCYHA